MKILLIDNGTSYLQQLLEVLSPAAITVVPFQHVTQAAVEAHDLIILSGGHRFTVITHRRKYARELNIIRESGKPILGICLGFELIVVAFGGKLKLLRHKIHREVAVTFTRRDAITRQRTYRVFESHQRGVRRLPSELTVLARSTSGAEIIKHVSRPIYGFQFHPEMTGDGSTARLFRQTIRELLR